MYNKEQDVIVLGTYDKRVRILVAFCIFMLLLGMSGAAVSGRAYADERRLVKVAFFPMDGYHIKHSDGTYGGMDVEYLDALCRYVNWEIEYVECDSWEEALELLDGKKVDLVGSAQYSEERAQIYQYASLSSGYTFGVIATNADSTLAYEDFEALKDATFGIVKGYVRAEEFLQYLADHGIQNPKLLQYESTAALQAALDAGEIDAFVHSFTEVEEGQRLVGRFAPMPFYYMTYQGNDDVIRELNQAIAALKMNRPELETELMNRFYRSRLDKTIVLTTEEKEYIAEGRTIPVGYVDGHYPFCYEVDGEFTGLTRELLEETVMSVGLNLEFLSFSTYREAEEALQNGIIEVLTFCAESEDALKERHLDVVKEYAEIPLVLVMNKHKSMSDIDTLATVEYLSKAGELICNDLLSSTN